VRTVKDLSIIIVNWNSCEYLKTCIASILATVRQVSYEIVVIDAGSFDGCGEMLREYYPTVRFVQHRMNVGFARANNCAFECSVGDNLLFLNPDTEVGKSAVDTMSAVMASLPDAGIVGTRIMNGNGTVQSSCVQSLPTMANQALDSDLLRRLWPKSALWGMSPLFDAGPAACEVECITGACLMIRRSIFDRVGRFSEDYFMYAEDLDLSYKVRAAGYKNYYVPCALVVHHGGQSSQQAGNVFATVMAREAIRRFLRKTRGTGYAVGYRFTMLLCAVVRLCVLGAAWIGGSRSPSRLASCRKWFAILRWSLNRDGLVAQYYRDGE
jgi:N-acetylglucosaminyl-diphospho-decaprenol L-rhamnosyltransferase